MATNSLADSILNFSLDLYKQLVSEDSQHGNIFFSPFSISAALSMALGGARGSTAKELSAVLRVDGDVIHSQFSNFFSKLPGYAEDVKLYAANRMYCEQTYPVLESYLSFLKDSYEATIESVDFRNNSESVRQQVNAWVENATESKIKDLLPSGSLDSLSTLVLINAIYFKGLWKSQFNVKATRLSCFHIDSKTKKEVDTMYQKSSFKMGSCDELDVTALEIPYQGGKTSMVILLPNDIEGLSKLEDRLTDLKLKNLFNMLRSRPNVELYMPKFKLEHTIGLKNTLQTMGINDFFSGRADLSAISAARNLVATDVVHKAFVEVSEEGTEAAAATAVVMMCRSAMPMRQEFIVDHPFMFFIRSHDPEIILFMGSVREL